MVVLLGFLGAGKTTVLRHWFTDSPATGRKIGIVMNEFGAVGVDTLLVRKPDLPVQEVAGGCLCCAADTDVLRAAEKLVRENGCDLVIVEPSGLADPVTTLDVLTDPEALAGFELRAVVGVLDARAFGDASGGEAHWPMLRDQIRYSDWHLVSKCDVAPEEAAGRLMETCRALNPGAVLRRLPFHPPGLGEVLEGRPTLRTLEPSPADPGTTGPEPAPAPAPASASASAGHLHATYRSLEFRFPLPVGRPEFEAFLRELDRREVVRAKGFVRFSGLPGKTFLFQMVYGHFLIDEFRADPAPEPVAVLIGPALDPDRYRVRLQQLVWGRGGFPIRG